MLRPTTTWIAAAALTGCSTGVTLEDDFSPEAGEWGLDDDGNRLHGPYVQGTVFELRARGVDPESEECASWRIEVDDPTVLSTDDDQGCRHVVVAAARGATRVRLLEDGDERAAAELEVTRPDRVTLHPRGALLAGLPDGEESIESARVLVGGLATFALRWWEQDRELSGRVLEASAPEALRLAPLLGLPLERSWVQVTPRTLEGGTIDVGFGGEVLATLAIEPVASEDLDRLTVVEAEDEDTLLAVATDGDGEVVFGVQADWSVDGRALEGEGDLLRYQADDGATSSVQARAEGLDAEIAIALRDEPTVGSSNSCAAVPGASPAGAGVAAGLVSLAALLTRRRRR